MNKIISLDGRDILYELERKKVKNINLRIRSDCSVYVSANNGIADNIITDFLKKKSAFILSAIDKYAEIQKYADNKHSYVTGESFRYLGKDIRLIVKYGKNNVSSDGVYITLSVKDPGDEILKKKLLDRWYKTQCWLVTTEIAKNIYCIFKKYNVPIPKLSIRNMISRWGSCQPKRRIISLNLNLIEAPRNAIEYVIMHEFIHFLYQNHSDKFYNMLSTLMPDWKARKDLLETMTFKINV